MENSKTTGSTDQITVLVCADGHSAAKRFVRDPDGAVRKIDYNAGSFFGVILRDVNSISTLSQVLQGIETLPDALVIRGAINNPAADAKRVRRRKENFSTPSQGRRWVLIDFDKIPLPDEASLSVNPLAVIEHLIGLLPSEFHQSSYHYQLSSSAGMGDPNRVSAHVWFWLSEPWTDADLKMWAKGVNGRAGYKLIDPALFNDVQAHYTAVPIFEGVPDPFPQRSGLVEKHKDSVSIQRLQVTPSSPSVIKPSVDAGPGFEGWLALIGDHPGGEGFHDPIIRAIASYVSQHGTEGTDKEALLETMRTRILKADRSKHDDQYVEQDKASRQYLMEAIEGALRKFGTKSISRKKSKHVADLPPHFESNSATADEASSLLDAELTRFFEVEASK